MRARASCWGRASWLYLDWTEVEGGGYYCVDSLSQGTGCAQQICSSSCLVCESRGSVANGKQSMRNKQRPPVAISRG